MLKMKVRDCDFTGRQYAEPVDGAGFFARGATGRVCLVMQAGPEWLAEYGDTNPTETEAEIRTWAESVPGGYLDY